MVKKWAAIVYKLFLASLKDHGRFLEQPNFPHVYAVVATHPLR
jgi:hypothetical protein